MTFSSSVLPRAPLAFASSNLAKQRELEQILDIRLEGVDLGLREIQDVEVRAVVHDKALRAFEKLQRPVVVDDTGLAIEEWRGLPGAFTSWFLSSVGIGGILAMAASVKDRRARAITALAYADRDGVIVFEGTVHGSLSETASGENGFGFDSVFVPTGTIHTLADLAPDAKNTVSPRRLAANQLRDWLASRSKQ